MTALGRSAKFCFTPFLCTPWLGHSAMDYLRSFFFLSPLKYYKDASATGAKNRLREGLDATTLPHRITTSPPPAHPLPQGSTVCTVPISPLHVRAPEVYGMICPILTEDNPFSRCLHELSPLDGRLRSCRLSRLRTHKNLAASQQAVF